MDKRSARSANIALILSTVAFTICFFGWTLYGPLAPALQKSLNLDELQIGWLVAIPVVLGSLMRVPLGYLAQRFGGRTTFVVLMVFVLLPLCAIALWHSSFAALLIFGLLLGFAGASFAVGVPFVNEWYPPARRGLALGIYAMGTGGTVIAGLTAPGLANAYGLWAPFALAAGLIVIAAILFFIFGRESPQFLPTNTSMWETFDIFRTSFRARALTLIYFVTFGGFVAMFLYLPRILGLRTLCRLSATTRRCARGSIRCSARTRLFARVGSRYGCGDERHLYVDDSVHDLLPNVGGRARRRQRCCLQDRRYRIPQERWRRHRYRRRSRRTRRLLSADRDGTR